jgi:hypothetical protein
MLCGVAAPVGEGEERWIGMGGQGWVLGLLAGTETGGRSGHGIGEEGREGEDEIRRLARC